MMQEMLKGVGNNSAISIPTTLTSNITNNNNTNNNNNNNNDNNLESSSTRQKLRCPRCNSNNTKFCYYNNYNLTQPRHFCKSCRRYWTKGGTLRNVPIGGGCRKNNKSSNITPKSKSLLSTEMLLNSGNNNNNNNPVDFLGPGLLGRVPHHSITQQTNSPILHLDLYSNGAPTLLGSIYPKSNGYSNQLVNEYGLFDENQRGVILGNLMTSSSSAANVRDILDGSRGSLVSYGFKNNEISCWSQFS